MLNFIAWKYKVINAKNVVQGKMFMVPCWLIIPLWLVVAEIWTLTHTLTKVNNEEKVGRYNLFFGKDFPLYQSRFKDEIWLLHDLLRFGYMDIMDNATVAKKEHFCRKKMWETKKLWPLRYIRNIVESGVKHHKSKPD